MDVLFQVWSFAAGDKYRAEVQKNKQLVCSCSAGNRYHVLTGFDMADKTLTAVCFEKGEDLVATLQALGGLGDIVRLSSDNCRAGGNGADASYGLGHSHRLYTASRALELVAPCPSPQVVGQALGRMTLVDKVVEPTSPSGASSSRGSGAEQVWWWG